MLDIKVFENVHGTIRKSTIDNQWTVRNGFLPMTFSYDGEILQGVGYGAPTDYKVTAKNDQEVIKLLSEFLDKAM